MQSSTNANCMRTAPPSDASPSARLQTLMPRFFTESRRRFLGAGWAVLLVVLACLIPSGPLRIAVGGDPETQRRGLDAPFLRGVWGAEPAEWDRRSPDTYRWTEPQWSVHIPFAGRGWFIHALRIDTTNWHSAALQRLTWLEPPLGDVPTPAALRTYHILTLNHGATLVTSVASPALALTSDRRALGVVLRTSILTPLHGVWQPWFGTLVLLTVVLAQGVARLTQTRWNRWVSTLLPLLILGALSIAPKWFMVHGSTLVMCLVLAVCSAVILVHTILNDRSASGRWIVLTSAALFFPLLAINSPFLVSSDSAMHARMLFDVMRGNLFQLAELPCEAGALTVPYPPLVYLLAAPFTLLTWDRSTAISVLMNGALILHTGALLYVWRVVRGTTACDLPAVLWMLVAAISLPFLQAVHIGELTNAWGHAVFLVAVASWHDEKTSPLLRGILLCAALLSHTGIALSTGLVFALVVLEEIRNRRTIPWQTIAVGAAAGCVALVVYYSGYTGLFGQPLKYSACPPVIPFATRFMPVLSALPLALVLTAPIAIPILTDLRARRFITVVLGGALLSIVVLVFRTQTVRWAIEALPAGALILALGYAATDKRWVRLILLLGACITVAMSYVALWERVYTYLH